MVAPEARERAEDAVAAAAEAPMSCSTAESGGGEAGTTLGPTLVEVGDHESELAREEVFGPVLALVRVPDLDAALEFTNGSRYGNAGAIFTSSGEAARLPLRRRSGHARRQHRPRPGRLVPVRGVEGLPATPTCTQMAPTRSTFTPGRR